MSGRGADLLTRIGASAANKLNAAIDNHLRRIDATAWESVGVVVLTNGEIVGRIGIAPAEMVPIVDMFLEGNNLNAFERLLFAHLFQKQIGGRTTRAAFGREKFDDDRLLLGNIVGGSGAEGPAGRDE